MGLGIRLVNVYSPQMHSMLFPHLGEYFSTNCKLLSVYLCAVDALLLIIVKETTSRFINQQPNSIVIYYTTHRRMQLSTIPFSEC